MRIVFFELEGWEEPHLRATLGADGHELALFREPLTPNVPKTLPVLAGCDVLSTFIYSNVNASVFEQAQTARLIATRSTGFDHISIAEARKRNVLVSNVPEYGSNTVAEHTLALLLALSRKVIPGYMRTRASHFSTDGLRGFDLRGKTIGLIGCGNIGLHVARMAESFNMKVIVYDPFPRATLADLLNFHYVQLDELLATSDIVSLHCPATPENRHLIRAETLGKMKRGAILINTARGTLVNTADLIAALESGQLAGAGLDVFEGEHAIKEEFQAQSTLERDQLVQILHAHRLLSREDVIVTPHNAFNSNEAIQRILDTTIANIRAFAKTGKPLNPV